MSHQGARLGLVCSYLVPEGFLVGLLLGLFLFLVEEQQSLRVGQQRCEFPLEVLCLFGVLVDVKLDGVPIQLVELFDGLDVVGLDEG